MVFAEFSHAIRNWLENPYLSDVMKSTIGWESNGKKPLYYGKSMSTNFLGPPHTIGFVGFFRAMGNWWENPCISHVISIPQDGNQKGKKHPYYGKNLSTNFPDPSHMMNFVAFSRTLGNCWENPCISHITMYTIGWEWEKTTHTMGKVWLPIS